MSGLPAACLCGALGYEQAVQWIGEMAGLRSSGHFQPALIGLAAVPMVIGLVWNCYQIASDAEDK